MQAPIKLFQFPRLFDIPNLSPFCCKLETWLRIAGIPYEVVDTLDPRKGPRKKVPFIEDRGRRIADTSLIIEHLVASRGVDPDAGLTASERAIATLVQRTLEEHYAFVLVYTHLVHEQGTRHTDVRFDAIPPLVRAFVARASRKHIDRMLWYQGLSRHSHEQIMASAIADWRAVLQVMSDGPFFFGDVPTTIDAIVFGALASSTLTPIETPVRDFMRAEPRLVAYAERMRARFFPELAPKTQRHAELERSPVTRGAEPRVP